MPATLTAKEKALLDFCRQLEPYAKDGARLPLDLAIELDAIEPADEPFLIGYFAGRSDAKIEVEVEPSPPPAVPVQNTDLGGGGGGDSASIAGVLALALAAALFWLGWAIFLSLFGGAR